MKRHNCSNINQAPASHRNERLTLAVVIITLVTMIAEIVAGIFSGSMALLSDGVHMGTHAVALFITLAAYIFARRHIDNPDYSFGTGKIGVLGGYTNAILLMIAGGAMIFESIERIVHPVNILFTEAIIVAIVGLIVNIVSAVILGSGHPDHSHHGHSHHGHSHTPSHNDDHNLQCQEDHSHTDHNLKAAYLHVITDALTSILAIGALLTAKYTGIVWADPAVGILGGVVVIKWAIGLLRQTANLLLDKGKFSEEISHLRNHLESETTCIKDIHIWQISEKERSLILSINTCEPKEPVHYHDIIRHTGNFDHITIEVNRLEGI